MILDSYTGVVSPAGPIGVALLRYIEGEQRWLARALQDIPEGTPVRLTLERLPAARIIVPRPVLQVLLDAVIEGDRAASGYLDTEEVRALREVAELLGVDPAGVTPEHHRQHFRVPLDDSEVKVLTAARAELAAGADQYGTPLDVLGVQWRTAALRRYRGRPGWIAEGRDTLQQATHDAHLMGHARITAETRRLEAEIAQLEAEQTGGTQ